MENFIFIEKISLFKNYYEKNIKFIKDKYIELRFIKKETKHRLDKDFIKFLDKLLKIISYELIYDKNFDDYFIINNKKFNFIKIKSIDGISKFILNEKNKEFDKIKMKKDTIISFSKLREEKKLKKSTQIKCIINFIKEFNNNKFILIDKSNEDPSLKTVNINNKKYTHILFI